MERAPPGKMRCFISRQTPIATQPCFALYPICIFSFTYTNDCVITVRLERHSITGWCVSFLTDTYNSWLPRCLLLITFSIQIAHDLFFILAKLTNILNRFKLMCSTTTRRRRTRQKVAHRLVFLSISFHYLLSFFKALRLDVFSILSTACELAGCSPPLTDFPKGKVGHDHAHVSYSYTLTTTLRCLVRPFLFFFAFFIY